MGTTVTTELVHDGERRDRIGRRHMPEERRRVLLEQFRESGLTRQAFARREGLRYTTFCTWVQRMAQAAGARGATVALAKRPGAIERPAPRIAFAEVALPAVGGFGLEVRLPDGTTVRGQRAEELAALVRALRR
jgi:hypothetical protein